MNDNQVFQVLPEAIVEYILSFLTALIPAIITIIWQGNKWDLWKKWRCKRYKSSEVKVFLLIQFMFISPLVLLGILWLVLILVEKAELNMYVSIEWAYIYIIIGWEIFYCIMGYIIFTMRYRIFVIKDSLRDTWYARALMRLLYVSIIITIFCLANVGAFMFIEENATKVLFDVSAWACVLGEIISLSILEVKGKFEYKRARLYIEEENEFKDVEVENICNSGEWVVVKSGECETRCLLESIRMIEYYNVVDEGEDV